MQIEDALGGIYDFRSATGRVWRVGYAPAPWDWTDWSYARGGRFAGRWDSPDGGYRTTYAGTTRLACLVEVLAPFRPDPSIVRVQDLIVEDEADAAIYPTMPPGRVPSSWFSARLVASAGLRGRYCDVAAARTISTLRPAFIANALGRFDLDDFDVSAITNSRPRALTQHVSRFLYERTTIEGAPVFDGVRFLSRHGVDLELWAVFERADDGAASSHLDDVELGRLSPRDPDVVAALTIHSLTID